MYNRAVILQTLGSLEAAIAAYVELAVYFPWVTEAVRAWYNRGVALESLQRSQEVLASYEQALKLGPLYPDAWYRQGMMLNRLGNADEASVSHKTALCLSQVFNNQSINCNLSGRSAALMV